MDGLFTIIRERLNRGHPRSASHAHWISTVTRNVNTLD